MSDERPAPLAGVLRVLYLIAILAATLSLVLTAVFSIYGPPGQGDEFAGEFEEEGGPGDSDYERNIGLILTLIGTTAMATGLVGFGARANALRSGLLLAGVSLFSAGVAVGFSGSNNWLTILTSGLAFAALAASLPALEDGLPIALGRGGA